MTESTVARQHRELAQLIDGIAETSDRNTPGHQAPSHVSVPLSGVPSLLDTLRVLVDAYNVVDDVAAENRRLGRENDRLKFALGEFDRTAEQQAHHDAKADHRADYAAARHAPVDVPVEVRCEKLRAAYKRGESPQDRSQRVVVKVVEAEDGDTYVGRNETDVAALDHSEAK